MPTFIVDWDGTCTEHLTWPAQGEWLPGAIDALRELTKHGEVLIFSCRTNPYEPVWLGGGRRDPSVVFADICSMRQMLDDAGLEDVELYLKEGKPAGAIYIDDRGFKFTEWGEGTVDKILGSLFSE